MTARGLFVAVIRLYRRWLSPVLGRHCRYEPTCSAYAQEAVQVHGAIRGVWLSVKRIGRCHPWARGGIDRVPLGREA